MFVREIRKRKTDTDLMHRISINDEDVSVAESWIVKDDMEINKHKISKGTWMLGVTIKSDTIWNMVKDGILTGLSIFGVGKRTQIEQAEPS